MNFIHFSEKAKEVGLEINVDKTKQMLINSDQGIQTPLQLNGQQIEIVKDFKYLGSMVASSENDIKIRKGQAWAAFWKLKDIWNAKNLSIDFKIRIYNASCISILLYYILLSLLLPYCLLPYKYRTFIRLSTFLYKILNKKHLINFENELTKFQPRTTRHIGINKSSQNFIYNIPETNTKAGSNRLSIFLPKFVNYICQHNYSIRISNFKSFIMKNIFCFFNIFMKIRNGLENGISDDSASEYETCPSDLDSD